MNTAMVLNIMSGQSLMYGEIDKCVSERSDTVLAKQDEMGSRDFSPYSSIMYYCAKAKQIALGKRVHAHIINRGHERDKLLGNLVINMYGKCGDLNTAALKFGTMHKRNVYTWTIMIACYIEHGYFNEALHLFAQMLESAKPNAYTLSTVLGACLGGDSLSNGKLIHSLILNSGLETDTVVGTALVNVYGKSGGVQIAARLFENIKFKNVVSWTSMVVILAENGYVKDAIAVFENMQLAGLEPNRVTYVSILDACKSLSALSLGRVVHFHISNIGLEKDVMVNAALVNMYGKCGSLRDARRVFSNIHRPDIVLSTTMIAAFAENGHSEDAFSVLQEMMQQEGKPNELTLTNILFACSHGGMLDKGCHWFLSANMDFSITPRISHYGCMVDLLGRMGLLDVLHDYICSMPILADLVVWRAFLAACDHVGIKNEYVSQGISHGIVS